MSYATTPRYGAEILLFELKNGSPAGSLLRNMVE
jgi:hypothetical protein